MNEDGYIFIDSPGINDSEKNRSDILLGIAKYLHGNKIKPDDIFIIYV